MVVCMHNVGFSAQEVELVFDQVVAILNLGNVEFDEPVNDNQGPVAGGNETTEFLQNCAKLLQVDLKELSKCMTYKSQKIANETILSALSVDQAFQSRDTFAKQLYA